jgi:hypothetical protein
VLSRADLAAGAGVSWRLADESIFSDLLGRSERAGAWDCDGGALFSAGALVVPSGQ